MAAHVLENLLGNSGGLRRRIFGGVLALNLDEEGQGKGLYNVLGVCFFIGILDHHHLQKCPDGAVIFQPEMDEFIGKPVGGRHQEKVEQPEVGGKQREKRAEKGLLLDQDADDSHVFVVMDAERVAGEGLSGVKLPLADGDAVAALAADGAVFALVGKIKIKEIMAVELLVVSAALMYQNQNFFVFWPRPAAQVFPSAVQDHVLIRPV